jgi:acyl-ACP thioesterase
MKHYFETFIVNENEVDEFGHICIQTLQKKIQNASNQHGYLLGFGFKDMNQIGLFWVVSRLMVEINFLPKLNQEITIETWLEAPSSAGINRYYQIVDQNMQILITGVAKWSLVSRDTLKLVKTNEFGFITDLEFNDELIHFSFPVLKKIPRQDINSSLYIVKRKVSSNELDENNHVNNTVYIQYVIDGFKGSLDIHMYQISYVSPLYENDRFELYYFEKNNQIIVEGYQISSTKEMTLSFQALLIKK